MKIFEKLQHLYIKKIKKWMFCPVCYEKMYISKEGRVWECEHCQYIITDKDFKDDFVFWFCDECGSYLNIQEGFDRNSQMWQCKKCEHMNDLDKEKL